MPIYDVIIVGSGISALIAADRLADLHNVIILTKSSRDRSNSFLAQGGVAAAISKEDNWHDHFNDTIIAGCRHNDNRAVQILVKEGPSYIQSLIENGLRFDRDSTGALQLGQEGAHLKRRILHAGGDSTGKEIVTYLLKRLNGRITIIEDATVLDLLIENNCCIGVLIADSADRRMNYYASHVVIATGGCGGLYDITSNDSTVVGEGLALAYRAGACLTDLEFIQFHPTMLCINGQSHGLISEAVRGEGAFLVTKNGREIMKGVHPLEDLAPRDVVARTIQLELNRGNEVFLNISMIDEFKNRFPTITTICERAGVNVEQGIIPVVPGAHFLMGGIQTNTFGETAVNRLYAIGEAACTGSHGANRLASNSLLEGIVFANRVADLIIQRPFNKRLLPKMTPQFKKVENPKKLCLPSASDVKKTMTKYVGIARSEEGLSFAKSWFETYNINQLISLNVNDYRKEQVQTMNMLLVSWLICSSALERKESRGGHYRIDFPAEKNEKWLRRRIIRKRKDMCSQKSNMVEVEI